MLRKYRPRTPDPFIGVIQGDNELARLAHINDLVDQFRRVNTFGVPTAGSTIEVIANNVETIVNFQGLLVNDFTINVSIGNMIAPGDRMYIFLEGDSPTTVTFTGPIVPTQCGDTENTYQLSGSAICLEVIYSGTSFIGIDNC